MAINSFRAAHFHRGVSRTNHLTPFVPLPIRYKSYLTFFSVLFIVYCANLLKNVTVQSLMLLMFNYSILYGVHLEPYAIEAGSLTVSGFSSGGAMATQFHVAFSADINGVGIFSGCIYQIIKRFLSQYMKTIHMQCSSLRLRSGKR